MSMHKLSTIIVRNTDSLLMSSFIGLATVGLYSNYRLVINALNNLMGKFAVAFSGSIGNFAVMENSDRLYKIYKEMDFMFFVMSAYLTGGLMMLFNPFITLLFGGRYCFPMTTVMVIVAEFYITRMRQTNLLFREAMGLFWNDRYKAVAESIINLVASLVLVRQYGVTGIIWGTIISTLCTCLMGRTLHLFEVWRSGCMEEETSGLFCRVSEAHTPYSSGLCGSGAVGAAVPGGQFRYFYSGWAALHSCVRRSDRTVLPWQRRI